MLPREEFDDKLQDFDKLLLIKCFRNELLPEAFSEFIIRKMTKYFVEPPSGAMEIIYPDLSVYTPLVYILTTGADPTAIIMSLQKRRECMIVSIQLLWVKDKVEKLKNASRPAVKKEAG